MARITAGDSNIECPPLDTYILRFTNTSDIFLGDAWGEGNKPENERKKVKQIDLTFKITDYDEEDDEDGRDWTGFEVENRYTIGVNFNHPESKIGAMIRALERFDKVPDDYDRDLEELYGTKIKATVGPSDKGYARISSPLPHRTKRAKAEVVEPKYEDDDGAALFDEDAA